MRNKNAKRRVVVTGLGVVSSIGIGWQEFWKNLLAGKSGISDVSSFATDAFDRKKGGEVKNFPDVKCFSSNARKKLGRTSQMAIVAAQQALCDSKINDVKDFNSGICIGTTMGEPLILETMNRKRVLKDSSDYPDRYVSMYPTNAIGVNVAEFLNLKGKNMLFANACASGNFSLGHAFEEIQNGRSMLMLAGGADSFSRITFTGFHRLAAIAPQKCQPFDKNRQGMIPGEGAGILVLEDLEHAQKRGASVYAEILGGGASSDAFHLTQPQARGGIKAIKKALNDAGVNPEDVDYINAHGTGTLENDRTECEVFKTVFGERLKAIPVSSIKSMLGHTMGAAAALESIACCLALKDQKIPPTINYETPDPECDIDCVPNMFRKHKMKVILNNSLAFGGNNNAVLFCGI